MKISVSGFRSEAEEQNFYFSFAGKIISLTSSGYIINGNEITMQEIGKRFPGINMEVSPD